MHLFRSLLAALWLVAVPSGILCIPSPGGLTAISERQSTDRYVFAHFMIGIVSDRTSSTAYDADFQRAKALGIDAFALNIGTDFYTDTQLGYAYASAAANDMKVFISFDFNWWSTSQGTAVGQKIAHYASLDAQLKVDNKVFASSFAGDGVDVSAIRTAAGVDLYWAPNFHPSYGTNFSTIDGALNWMAWPNNGNNKAPTAGANVTVEEGDAEYIAALAVSPWFSTHFGPEVSYSKNWVFPGDLLWYDRWNEILSLGPRFVEIVTWNDYGESHYIGPLDSPHYDDGNSKWTNDMPHDGWMDIAKPFISAFKDGVSSANSYVTTDELVYWYRPTLKSIDCDATDTTMVTANNGSGNYFEGRPNGYESLSDSVFVVSLLTSAGIITVESGSTIQEFYAPQGISAYEVPMNVGKQQFFLSRNGQTTMSAVSLKNISDVCPCGIYNFNAYVGTVPESAPDQLQPDGLNSLTAGLHVTTCLATPSLGTVAITPASTPAITVSSGATSPVTTTTSPTTTTTTTTTTTVPKTTSTTTSTTITSITTTITTTISTTTSTTTSTTVSTTSTTSSATSTSVCVAGQGPGNYAGLCSFCCNFGYCPPGPCTCTAYGCYRNSSFTSA
ncbi:hypothetical protein VM1G_05453 [Cytospora mali]|uniref:Mutanase n=1 Tax=Cytospora mali TaxID=578113 RepID=A0A194VYL7_CYTMA|nr:hypothetical protein VM1G_05453 [Valsa mali]